MELKNFSHYRNQSPNNFSSCNNFSVSTVYPFAAQIHSPVVKISIPRITWSWMEIISRGVGRELLLIGGSLFCMRVTSRRTRARKCNSVVWSVVGVSPARRAAHFQDRNIKPKIYSAGVPVAVPVPLGQMHDFRPRYDRPWGSGASQTKGWGPAIDHKTLSYDQGFCSFDLTIHSTHPRTPVCILRVIIGTLGVNLAKNERELTVLH